MAEIKLRVDKREDTAGTGGQTCPPGIKGNPPEWVIGTMATEAGTVYRISGEWSRADFWGQVKCRIGSYRDHYTVPPGLYAIGEPDKTSDVFASANYKLSFDILRREIKGLNAWILVLDTKGINVWCAAGKGAFGTDELIGRISGARLDKVVDHRKIILPQLGAPGVSAHVVSRKTGFSVSYGPVDARDIPAYVKSGYKKTAEMRTVRFALADRLVLTPMEITPAMRKYYPLFALLVLVLFGLQPSGILFRDALSGGLPFLFLGLTAVLAGAFITPVLLPFIPFRSFALKGLIAGIAITYLTMELSGYFVRMHGLPLAAAWLFFPLASSYIALQFTGSTTFTGMSGVKKELKIAIPVYIFSSALSIILLLVFKLYEWRIIT